MHEDNLPVARLLLEESRFQPLQLRGAGSVGNTTFVDVGDPSGVVADVHVGFGHIPLVMFAGGVLGFDKGHNSVSVEAEAAIEDVKAWSNDGIELCPIVGRSSGEDRADCVDDVLFLGFSVYVFNEKRHNR